MKTFQIECGNCNNRMILPLAGPSVNSECQKCGNEILVDVFPALLHGAETGRRAEDLIIDEESSCFYHHNKKAVIACEGCGRFLCSLCEVEFDNRRLCPACIESGASKGRIEGLKKETVRYDSIALAVAIVPMLLFYVTLITAPVALYLAIKHWNTQVSIMPRWTRLKFALAIIIAGLQVIGWMIAAVFLIAEL